MIKINIKNYQLEELRNIENDIYDELDCRFERVPTTKCWPYGEPEINGVSISDYKSEDLEELKSRIAHYLQKMNF